MANRSRNQPSHSRKVATRDEKKTTTTRELLTFSFKDLDQTQPDGACQTIDLWHQKLLLAPLKNRLIELSKLTRDEAKAQQQIKVYGDFPPAKKTDFKHPKHVDSHVAWAVIEGIGGLPRVAGYIVESTFYIVFLDSEHKFWKSELKHS
ncbi:hypothetical protein [Aeromonas salmonicida]|uniref:hypothetical protein n=1 Tax=Aeromonas salmonicida TaxID=645 RepID=UPI0021161F57|nr:hypothetical protein [Aeromonas salmonicida]UUI62250.1 hypothetical protein NP805_06695 [Aeromonas salmonicida]